MNENKPIVGWVRANERTPIEDSIKREIHNKKVIPNQHIYEQTEDRIIMQNDYDRVGINGREIMFSNIEWLDESPIDHHAEMSEEELEKMVSELYPLADPRKNMHHDNGGQRAKQEAFKQGYKLHKSNHAEMQKEIERLRSGIKVIEQMSDCGSYELTIVRMKQYATELLTTALTGTKQ